MCSVLVFGKQLSLILSSPSSPSSSSPTDCSEEIDLAFILDASGSVSLASFQLMTQFASDVVDVMNVSSDAVRVADIVYSSAASLHFGLDGHSDKAAVKAALIATPKSKGVRGVLVSCILTHDM